MGMLIEEQDVTPVRLAVELERAVVQHVLDDDGSLYVTEDGMFPFWIRLHKGSRLVSFKTHTCFKQATSAVQRLEICNEINACNFLLTAYVKDDTLCLDHALMYRGGLLRETFIRGCRQFARSVEKSIDQADPQGGFILPPGETEAQDEQGEEGNEGEEGGA